MKIAIFHELHSGGARRAVLEMAGKLKKDNTVDLYVVDELKNIEDEKFFNNTYYYLFSGKSKGRKGWLKRIFRDSVDLVQLYFLQKRCARDIDSKKYDIVFVHPSRYTQAPFILRFLKTPTVYYCEEVLRMIYEPDLHKIHNAALVNVLYEKVIRLFRKKIDRKNIISANVVLANSIYTKENIMNAYQIHSEAVYLGVNTEFFKPMGKKKDIDVLYVGAKDEIDGYVLLKEAVRKIGRKVNVYYHITGKKWLSDSDLRDLYNRAKIVVCLAKNEPFGLIALEAMSCGVPVIAVSEGGYKETVLNGKTGFLTLRVSDKISEKIQDIISDVSRYKKMSENAREHVLKNWTWEKTAQNLTKVFITVKSEAVEKKASKKNLLYAAGFVFVLSMGVRLLTLNQIGRTYDEFLYVEQGYVLTELLLDKDLDNSFFYTSYDHPPLVKYLYGITAHFDFLEKNSEGWPVFNYDYTYSRILSSFIFSCGVILTVIIGSYSHSLLAGLLAGLILALLPFSLGLSQLVTTESFKIFISPLVYLFFIRFISRPSKSLLIWSGIFTGIALQIKQSNALLLPTFAFISWYYYHRNKKKFLYALKKTLFPLIIMSVVAVVIFFLIWPQALFHYGEISKINSHLWHVQFSIKPWQITLSPPEIFFGQLILTPIFYYVVYFIISIPLAVLVLFAHGVLYIRQKRNWILVSLLIWFLVPFVMSIYSWRQHGLRYIIEIYPPLCIIAGIGMSRLLVTFTKSLRQKIILISLLTLYLIATLFTVKPYYLDYFNELIGGTNNVYQSRLFQQGWWGQGLREAGIYINKHAEKDSHIGLAIFPPHVFPKSNQLLYSEWNKNSEYDYVVVSYYHVIRDGFDDNSIKREYELIYEVKADDATLIFIYKKI